MNMLRSGLVLALGLFFCCLPVSAQTGSSRTDKSAASPFQNRVYEAGIHAVQCYAPGNEASLPLISLGSGASLVLSFDDLRSENHNIYYTIQHCDASWNASAIFQMDYLDGYSSDRINTFGYSNNTLIPYKHYELNFPSANMLPKIAGNYVLKLYDDGDENKLILTRRFYVLNSRASLSSEIITPLNAKLRDRCQQVKVTVEYPNLQVQNPFTDLKVAVSQNNRPDTRILMAKPSYVYPGRLVYADINSFVFEGNNEFRVLDIRSLRTKTSASIEELTRDSLIRLKLRTDSAPDDKTYVSSIDNNGNFYLRNTDPDGDALNGDYADVLFSFKPTADMSGKTIYLTGGFTDYNLSEANKLSFDNTKGRFFLHKLLKQGVYDYQYVSKSFASTTTVNISALEGSFFQTRNSYQTFLYYRKPGTIWDELVGFTENTIK